MYKMTDEHKLKISLANRGKHKDTKQLHTPEAEKKSAESKKGKPWTGGKSTFIAGSKHSEATKLKMSIKKMGRKLSLDTKIKLSEINKGSNSYLWKGGITPISKKIRNSLEYRLWRNKVYKRDNYTCQECGARNGNGYKVNLNAHHVKSFSNHIKLRFSITNGITLCEPCHIKTDSYGNKKTKGMQGVY